MAKEKYAHPGNDLQITRFNVLDHLKTDTDMADYLEACLEEGGPELFFAGLGDVIKAKGIARIAKDTGLSREALYKTFESGRQPQFDTVWKITNALGLNVSIESKQTYPKKADQSKRRQKREEVTA